jgi:hypothetical protein
LALGSRGSVDFRELGFISQQGRRSASLPATQGKGCAQALDVGMKATWPENVEADLGLEAVQK